MAHTRIWSITWETNISQKRLPPIEKLKAFLDYNASEAIFQVEKGSKKNKKHYQGIFILDGARTSKTGVLKLFAGQFKNTSGLSISPVFDKLALTKYVTKKETRISGPYYCGRQEQYDEEFAKMILSDWQKKIYNGMCSEDSDKLRGRHLISIHDTLGKSGKSQFVKWLRTGQKKLKMRKLPFASVQQLNSAICKITKNNEIDLVVIDLTRSQGKDQSFTDLFSALEDIINGYVVDVMYGGYNEALFKPPMVMLLTNYRFQEVYKYMSHDRWIPFVLDENKELLHISYTEELKYLYFDKFKSLTYKLEEEIKSTKEKKKTDEIFGTILSKKN